VRRSSVRVACAAFASSGIGFVSAETLDDELITAPQ
jgi:hypothetical protein